MGQYKVIKHTCPACSKEHDLMFYTRHSRIHLDAVPRIPIAQLLQRCVICSQCGLLYGLDMPIAEDATAITQTPEYQRINTQEYASDLEKKFAILSDVYHYPWVPLYRAHHAHHSGNTQKRQKYLQQALELTKVFPNFADAQYFSEDFHTISFNGPFFYENRNQEIDILRQLGRFEQALRLLHAMEDEELDTATEAFITKEKQLIKQQNKDPK